MKSKPKVRAPSTHAKGGMGAASGLIGSESKGARVLIAIGVLGGLIAVGAYLVGPRGGSPYPGTNTTLDSGGAASGSARDDASVRNFPGSTAVPAGSAKQPDAAARGINEANPLLAQGKITEAVEILE